MSVPSKEITYINPNPIVIEQKNETVELSGTLKRICACESVWNPTANPKQFDENGDVLRGRVNPQDIGACQINLRHWGEKASELGFDIFTEEGNKKMAQYIYNTAGTSPWYLSSSCWNK